MGNQCCSQQQQIIDTVPYQTPLFHPGIKILDEQKIVDLQSNFVAEEMDDQQPSQSDMLQIEITQSQRPREARLDIQRQLLYDRAPKLKLDFIEDPIEEPKNGCHKIITDLIFQEGLFKNDELIYGTLIQNENGQNVLQQGYFNNGFLEGEGIQIKKNYYFQGIFKQGEKIKGKEKTNSHEYEGDYKYDKWNGQGKLRDQFGIYEGDFKNNMKDGSGEMVYNDGRSYKGFWYQDRMYGLGMFTWPDQCKFIGNYQDDQKEGYGEFYWADGLIFKGQFKQGLMHGFGILTDGRGNKQNGVWHEGVYSPGETLLRSQKRK
ncbi:hypothetical protein pb186bvf_013037 [Paramecium bursaria]